MNNKLVNDHLFYNEMKCRDFLSTHIPEPPSSLSPPSLFPSLGQDHHVATSTHVLALNLPWNKALPLHRFLLIQFGLCFNFYPTDMTQVVAIVARDALTCYSLKIKGGENHPSSVARQIKMK